ncbi:hypothetical protein PG275_09200 [Riemerella anatipestifer]|nr:hypothetical protein [Riemerella anatipestifer]
MSEKSIRISKETHNLLTEIKERYTYPSYDISINLICLFIIRNSINPKDNFVGDFKSELLNLERRLLQSFEKSHSKITKDNASLRSWVGGITKDHLVPITKKLSVLDKISDLDFSNISDKKEENSKIENPLNLGLKLDKDPSDNEEKYKEKLEELNTKVGEYFSKYNDLKKALFKIFDNSKIERGGMLSPTKIVVDLSEEEWLELKEKI